MKSGDGPNDETMQRGLLLEVGQPLVAKVAFRRARDRPTEHSVGTPCPALSWP